MKTSNFLIVGDRKFYKGNDKVRPLRLFLTFNNLNILNIFHKVDWVRAGEWCKKRGMSLASQLATIEMTSLSSQLNLDFDSWGIKCHLHLCCKM